MVGEDVDRLDELVHEGLALDGRRQAPQALNVECYECGSDLLVGTDQLAGLLDPFGSGSLVGLEGFDLLGSAVFSASKSASSIRSS